jgi:hypothetical protein
MLPAIPWPHRAAAPPLIARAPLLEARLLAAIWMAWRTSRRPRLARCDLAGAQVRAYRSAERRAIACACPALARRYALSQAPTTSWARRERLARSARRGDRGVASGLGNGRGQADDPASSLPERQGGRRR